MILLTHHNIKTINNTRRKQLQYITATAGWSIIGLAVLEGNLCLRSSDN